MSSDKIGQDVAIHAFEVQTDIALKYGINLPARTIQLVGEIDQNMFILIDTALTILESQSKAAVTIKINSEGGAIYDALAIVGRMKNSKCKIVTEGYGCIMSAASLVLAAGDKRKMSGFSWFMHHEGSYDFGGTVEQHRHITRQMEREERLWAENMAKFTTCPKDYWLSQGKLGKDLYLTAAECLNFGVIDEVI